MSAEAEKDEGGKVERGVRPELAKGHPWHHAMRSVQDRLIVLLGSTTQGRSEIVASQLRRDVSEATSYWLQLVVSIGIATLGLVLGSTAVVIGAMLVAPLMGPIIALALGLSAGSPFLVLRSAGRIGISVALAVSGAATITLLLPYYELNDELLARATPTVLDLVTAAFCALAGVYASLRSGSDSATTAAGTAISISLVPPLCASGYGVGTLNWSVAGGAALLFLTNLVAIIAVGTVGFVAAGFNQVDVVALEREELRKGGADARLSRTVAKRLSRVFESRWGPVLRFLMPFLLLAAVYVPLRRALDEVAWEVRARAVVLDALAVEPHQLVQSRVRVERHQVDLVLVLLGQTADADATRVRLGDDILRGCGVAPHIEVMAIPDANAFAGLESTLRSPAPVVEVAAPPPLPTPDEQLDASRDRIRAAVEAHWPSASAGRPLRVAVGTESTPLELRVVHLGAALGADARESVAISVREALGREVVVVDAAIPATPITREEGDVAFIARVSSALRDSESIQAISTCVTRPDTTARRRVPPQVVQLETALDALLVGATVVGTGDWSVRFVEGPCPSPAAVGAPPSE